MTQQSISSNFMLHVEFMSYICAYCVEIHCIYVYHHVCVAPCVYGCVDDNVFMVCW